MAVSESPDTVGAFAADLTTTRGRLTIREVHRRSGIPTATLGGYFAGRHLPPANRPEVLAKVLEACGVPARDRAAWHRRLVALHDQRRQPAVTRTPYPGLRAFDVGDHDLFFGREQMVDQLLDLVVSAAGADHPVVAVVGPSGSGKSSLLRAGLQAGLGDVSCTVCSPTELAADVEAVLGESVPGPDEDRAEPTGLTEVLVLDQLEEIWTQPDLRARPDDLPDRLREWAHAVPGRVLVLGVRADFYGEAMVDPLLEGALQTQQLLVGPLDHDAMRAAIEGPASRVGLTLEPGLADVILADVREDSVGSPLPHLAHVLGTMWGSSDRRSLTLEGYREAGGLEGAIRQTAEETLSALPVERQRLAMTLLLRMVTTASQGWTRRLVRIEDLFRLEGPVEEVLSDLVDRRLVTVRTDDATLSHESLVGAWPRLRALVEARRGDLARRETLDRAAQDWDAYGRGEDHLLRGARLEAALEWRAVLEEPLTVLQEDYLSASQALAGRLAEERRASRRRRRAVVAALAVLLLVTTGAGLLAVDAFGDARTQRDQAQSRQLATAAANLRDTNPSLSQQLAVAAYRTADTREARSAVLDATTSPVVSGWSPEGAALERVAVLADGEHVLLSGPAGGVQVVRELDGDAEVGWEPVASVTDLGQGDRTASVTRLEPHPDRPWVLVVGRATTEGVPEPEPLLALVDLTDPASPRVVPWEVPGLPTDAAFVSDGGLAVVADAPSDGTGGLVVTEAALQRYAVGPDGAGTLLGAPEEVGDLVEQLDTDDGGELLAAALSGGLVRTWQTEGELLLPHGEHQTTRGLFALDVADDGQIVAAVGRSGLLHWIDVGVDELTETRSLYASDTSLFDVEIDEAGQVVAVGGFEGTVSMWRTDDEGPVNDAPSLVLPVPRPVLDLDVSGSRWVFGTLGGTAYSWDTRGAVLPRLPSNVFMVDASTGGDLMMTASGPPTGDLWLWDATDPHAPALAHVLEAGTDDVSTGAGALSPDGRLAAMGTAAGKVLVWQLEGERATKIVDVGTGATGTVFVAFAPDGGSVLGFGREGQVQVIGLVGDQRGEVLGETEMFGALMTAALRDDGLLAVADDTRRVYLQRTDDLEAVLTTLRTDALVYGMDFSPDGKVLAMSLSDSSVLLFDVSDPGDPTQIGDPLTGPTSNSNSVKFSPDGERLALAALGGQAWIYELRDGEWVATEVLRAGLVNLQDVAWSADGSALLGGALSGRTRLWLTDVEEAAESVCAGVGEEVTQVEWEGLLPGIDYAPPCVD